MHSIFVFSCIVAVISNFTIFFIIQIFIFKFLFTSIAYFFRHWKTWWNMFAYFRCRRIFRIIFTTIRLFLLIILIVFWLQDDTIVCLRLKSLKEQLAFHEGRIYFFYFSIQNIKINCYIIFLKFFPIIVFWRIVYSFSIIFIYKKFNFCYSLWVFFFISS